MVRLGPLPSEEGYRASKEIIARVDQAGPDDLFIAVIGSGSSALMSCLKYQPGHDSSQQTIAGGSCISSIPRIALIYLRP
ncbi:MULTISPECIES: DUF4147 domain-containing protein [unclassified Burkholderia]|uniref:DUF4147 domain-containing protein n=1 Tax=unclassified Burkholderia TaxID=2613784 RepID=UPI001FC8E135|nr:MULTISPECIES: DUF4147 domain-containing protein [unclassified Burkholderia]